MEQNTEKMEIHPVLQKLRIYPNASNGVGSYFFTNSGDKLYYRSWSSSKQKAIIVGIHGMAAHSEYYVLVADHLINEGFSVIGLDLKHHGLSTGKTGDLKSFPECTEHINEFITQVRKTNPNTPIFLMGQSMGSIISINYSIDHPETIDGLILTSPGVKSDFKLSVSDILKIPLLLLVYLFKKGACVINVENRSSQGTRVPLREKYQKEDKLRIKKISPRYLLGLLKWKKKAFENAKKITRPTIILLGSEDKIVSVEGVKKFFELIKIEAKKLVELEGAFHSLFSDPAMIEQGGWDELQKWLSSIV